MRELLIGVILLLASFAFDFFPTHSTAIVILYASTFCLSLFYIYDGIIILVKGTSYMRGRYRKVIRHILLVGIIAGVATEAIGNWLYKFWIYPHFSSYFYLLVVPISLCLYFFLLFENYIAIHVVLEKFFPSPKIVVKRKKLHTIAFSIIGFLGIATFSFVTCSKLLAYKVPSNILNIFNTYWLSSNDVVNLFMLCISIWFIFEYLEYQRREDTLLLHIFKGDFTAFLSIIVASLITSVVMEIFNLPIKIWIYTNVPYYNIVFLGVPIVVLFLWPFQYLLFDCFYHFIYKKETEAIWTE